MLFGRKIYDKLLKWKNTSDGSTALLIEGARRVGKSTVAEFFAKKEYESYILIDFAFAPQHIQDLFKDGRYDYIETGSLISIKKNIQNILLPSEEKRIEMNPMDFEEFLWATGAFFILHM